MKDPILKSNRALYGHPCAESDSDAYFALQCAADERCAADEQCWMAWKTHRKELAEVIDSACRFLFMLTICLSDLNTCLFVICRAHRKN